MTANVSHSMIRRQLQGTPTRWPPADTSVSVPETPTQDAQRPATARMVPTRQTQRGTDDVQDSGMVSRKPGRVDYRRSQLRSGRREPNSYHQFGRWWTRHGSGYPYSESPAVRRWWRSRHVPTGHESGSAVLRSNGPGMLVLHSVFMGRTERGQSRRYGFWSWVCKRRRPGWP